MKKKVGIVIGIIIIIAILVVGIVNRMNNNEPVLLALGEEIMSKKKQIQNWMKKEV